jgi:galactosylgalactosylxylosylprotein 3-beta-glucuronosyltransferase 3
MRWTKKVSVWPVGLVGGLKWEGPVCENGKVIKFWTAWDLTRPFPIDMAGFAINVKLILDNPSAVIDTDAPRGHLESSLLKLFVTKDELEPLADNCKKVKIFETHLHGYKYIGSLFWAKHLRPGD